MSDNDKNKMLNPELYFELTRNHSLALILNKCVQWSNKSECNEGWFYKTYEEWNEETFVSERTLRRYFNKLEEQGLITKKVKKVHGLNIIHIKPHMDKIYVDEKKG